MKARSARTIARFFKGCRMRKMREKLMLAIRRNIAVEKYGRHIADISFDHLRIGALNQDTLIGTTDENGV